MKNSYKHHIADNTSRECLTFCGRNSISFGGTTWAFAVKEVQKKNKPKWCKVCKKLYNANYSGEFRFTL